MRGILTCVDPDWPGCIHFVGGRWSKPRITERRQRLLNPYRVLPTMARQGMVIVVSGGKLRDATRRPEVYDDTFRYLSELGVPSLPE